MYLSLISLLLSGVLAQQPVPTGIPHCPVLFPEHRDPDHTVRPKYPKAALKAGTEGSVVLHATVGADGKMKELVALSGEDIFARPTVDAVGKWIFYPVVRDGQPVETTYRVRMNFSLLLREANPEITLESPMEREPSLPDDVPVEDTPDGAVYRVTKHSGVIGPKVTYQIDPEFPETARKEKLDGNVIVDLVVGTDGIPRNFQIQCSDIPENNEKALEAVRQWRFNPGTKEGLPVNVKIAVKVEFHLY